MKKLTSLVIAIAVLVIPSPVDAHHPEVKATALCENGTYTVNYAAEAWETDEDGRRINHGISVELSGPVSAKDSGKFNAENGYKFTGSFKSLPSGTYKVKVVSSLPWGKNGEHGSAGEWRETSITVSGPCAEFAPRVTTPLPKTPEVIPAPTSTTIVAAEGSSKVEVRSSSSSATPIAASPKFTG